MWKDAKNPVASKRQEFLMALLKSEDADEEREGAEELDDELVYYYQDVEKLLKGKNGGPYAYWPQIVAALDKDDAPPYSRRGDVLRPIARALASASASADSD
jgi:hypothetical protein